MAITNAPKHVLLALLLIIQHSIVKPVRLDARFVPVQQTVRNAHLRIHIILTFATLLARTQLLTQSTRLVLYAIFPTVRFASTLLIVRLAKLIIFSLLRMAHQAASLPVLRVTPTIVHYFLALPRLPAKPIQLLWQAQSSVQDFLLTPSLSLLHLWCSYRLL